MIIHSRPGRRDNGSGRPAASFAPRSQDSASVPAHDIEVLPVKEMFARGIYQHLVETRFDVPSVDVRRGESIAVSFTVEHYSHVEEKNGRRQMMPLS